MNFFQKIVKQLEYGDYTPVVKFGKIYSDAIGQEQFAFKVQLLQSRHDWVVRLDLARRWGSTGNRTVADCHVHTLDELRSPFQKLLQDVASGVTHPDSSFQLGLLEQAMLKLTAGQALRTYGRIDQHPRNEGRFRLQLYLAQDGQRYWFLLADGQGSVEWSKWPIGMAVALDRLFPRLEEVMKESSGQACAGGGIHPQFVI